MADELTFWNRQLSGEEVEAIRDMYLSRVSTFICLTSLTRAKPKEEMEFPA